MNIAIYGLIHGRGGIQSHMKYLTKAMLELGMHVFVVSPGSTDIPWMMRETGSSAHLQIHSCQPTRSNPIGRGYPLWAGILDVGKRLRDFNPDFYLSLGTGWWMHFFAAMCPRRTKRIFHEVMSGKRTSSRDPRSVVRYLYDEVFAQAHDVAHNFTEDFWPTKQIPVLPAFAEPLEITANVGKPLLRSVRKGGVVAAVFGRLAPHKNTLWLVRQWPLLQNHLIELHIHGTGAEEEEIKQFIHEQGVGDRVKCHGEYPDGQAYATLLSRYDLVLLPTLGDEGAPLVLLEAMACGVPFVSYGVGGIPDYGSNNPDVTIVKPEPWLTSQAREYDSQSPPHSNKAFLRGVIDMANKLADGRINQPRLQQYYLTHYSYENMKAKWLTHLTRVIR